MFNLFGINLNSGSEIDQAKRVCIQHGMDITKLPDSMLTLSERKSKNHQELAARLLQEYYVIHGTTKGFSYRGE